MQKIISLWILVVLVMGCLVIVPEQAESAGVTTPFLVDSPIVKDASSDYGVRSLKEVSGTRAADDYTYLRVTILEYQEDQYDAFDLIGGPGDPYFEFLCEYNGDSVWDFQTRTIPYQDVSTLSNIYLDIPLIGPQNQIRFQLNVWESDNLYDERIDYSNSTTSKSWLVTMSFAYLKSNSLTFGPYNGEDDGISGEYDCNISYKVELFNWNVLPVIDNFAIYGQDTFEVNAFEPFWIYSYVYDFNGDILTYSWDFGDGNLINDECPSYIYTTSGSFEVTLTVNDTVGQSKKVMTLIVHDYPYNEIVNSYTVNQETFHIEYQTDYTKTLRPKYDSSTFSLGFPFNMDIWLSLVVEVKIDHTGIANMDIITSSNQMTNILTGSTGEYTFSIWPYFEFHYVTNSVETCIPIPIPTSFNGVPLYDGQKSIVLGGYTIYYWDTYLPIGKNYTSDSLGEVLNYPNHFDIARLDLIKFITGLLDNAGYPWGSMISTARSFVSTYLGTECVLDLVASIDLDSTIVDELWLHQTTTNTYDLTSCSFPASSAYRNEAFVAPITIGNDITVKTGSNGQELISSIYTFSKHQSVISVSGSINLEYGIIRNGNRADLTRVPILKSGTITDSKASTYNYPVGLNVYNPDAPSDDDSETETDSDQDGLPDSWEIDNFGDLSSTANEDYDEDGYTNLQEYEANANPTDSSDIPIEDGEDTPGFDMMTIAVASMTALVIFTVINRRKRR